MWRRAKSYAEDQRRKQNAADQPQPHNVPATAAAASVDATAEVDDDDANDDEDAAAAKRTSKKTTNTISGAEGGTAESNGQPLAVSKHRTASDPLFRREEHGLRVLEALGATGLRAIRYYNEVPTLKQVVCNDLSVEAVASIRRNVEFNGLNPETQIVPHHGDGNRVMYDQLVKDPPPAPFHVIDLDPYGTSAPFLDAAVQAVADGGLLCVTCTDMAVLAGNRPDISFAKYGGMSIRAQYNHEMGVRVVLHLIASLAARYGRHMVPLLSCSIDFYCRVFVRIFDGANEARLLASKTCYAMQCTACQFHHVFYAGRYEPPSATNKGPKYKSGTGPKCGSECPQCGRSFLMAGPMWGAPMHDSEFVSACLARVNSLPADTFGTAARMRGMLSVCLEELADVPFHYTIDAIAGLLHCSTPRAEEVLYVVGRREGGGGWGWWWCGAKIRAERLFRKSPIIFDRLHPCLSAVLRRGMKARRWAMAAIECPVAIATRRASRRMRQSTLSTTFSAPRSRPSLWPSA